MEKFSGIVSSVKKTENYLADVRKLVSFALSNSLIKRLCWKICSPKYKYDILRFTSKFKSDKKLMDAAMSPKKYEWNNYNSMSFHKRVLFLKALSLNGNWKHKN